VSPPFLSSLFLIATELSPPVVRNAFFFSGRTEGFVLLFLSVYLGFSLPCHMRVTVVFSPPLARTTILVTSRRWFGSPSELRSVSPSIASLPFSYEDIPPPLLNEEGLRTAKGLYFCRIHRLFLFFGFLHKNKG